MKKQTSYVSEPGCDASTLDSGKGHEVSIVFARRLIIEMTNHWSIR